MAFHFSLQPARFLADLLGVLGAERGPGTKVAYSNAGINTAGRIIEVVAKVPCEKFLQDRLFDPLGMKDTTFRPDEKQTERLAKSYRPNKANDGLEEVKIGQLTYPLSDRKRQPMPAGGLFSTASDLASFCRMMLNGGTVGNTRHLSEKAVKEMTIDQTGGLTPPWGLGFTAGKKEGDQYGHGGAHATNVTVDPKTGLVPIYMIQHAGFRDKDDNARMRSTFVKAATAKYAK